MYLTYRLKGQILPKAFTKRVASGAISKGEMPPPPGKPFNPEGLKYLFGLPEQDSISSILMMIVSRELDTSKTLIEFVKFVHRQELVIRIFMSHVVYNRDYTSLSESVGFEEMVRAYPRIINMYKIRQLAEILTCWSIKSPSLIAPVNTLSHFHSLLTLLTLRIIFNRFWFC